MEPEIIPSILSADFGRLEQEVQAAAEAGVAKVQVDVMDGRFVPNISVGLPVVRALAPLDVALDVHLMIEQPERYIDAFADAGADVLTVHVEATPHIHRAVEAIRRLGVAAGAAVNPGTPLVALEEVLADLDVALVMTVDPGFGGQPFIRAMLPKIARLRQMIELGGYRAAIQVDGGIDEDTVGPAARAGATQLVAGSAVFGAGMAVREAVARLRAAAAADSARSGDG
jgi:ribulose-phosphate 3-epimerase